MVCHIGNLNPVAQTLPGMPQHYRATSWAGSSAHDHLAILIVFDGNEDTKTVFERGAGDRRMAPAKERDHLSPVSTRNSLKP